jgi:ABC-type phosphate transport system auxiliary subunit
VLGRVKDHLDVLKAKFDKIQLEKNESALDNKVIQEEENRIVKELKDAKKEHKAILEKVKILKATIQDEEHNLKQVIGY